MKINLFSMFLVASAFLCSCVGFSDRDDAEISVIVRDSNGDPVDGAVVYMSTTRMFSKYGGCFFMTNAEGVGVVPFSDIGNFVVYKEYYYPFFCFPDYKKGDREIYINVDFIVDVEYPERNFLDIEKALVDSGKYDDFPGFSECRESLYKIFAWFEENEFFSSLEGDDLKEFVEKYR